MISFMHKHNKYFMSIIWVSTIAFIGAGFIGWGSYNFASIGNAAAKVGDTKITFEKMQREYARLYGIYNQILGGTLDEEQAKNIGIEDQALHNLITQALMLNYAHDLGLRVSQDEIIQEIASMDSFKNNGIFDEDLYKRILQENRLRAKDFEESVKENLLIQKLSVILDLPLTPLETQMLETAYFAEDLLQIKILNQQEIKFFPTEEDIKKYWEENKDIYQTQRGYEISIVSVDGKEIAYDEESIKNYYEDFKNEFLNQEGQILPFEEVKNKVIEKYKDSQAQKEALKEYISLRKGENQNTKTSIIYEGDGQYSQEFMNLLSQAKEKETLKPFKNNDSYVSVQILRIIPSQPKTYETAKKDARKDYIEFEKTKLLEEKAQKESANFKGVNVGYLGKGTTKKLEGLTPIEQQNFINQLFNTKEDSGYILLENKAVLYKILNQRVKKSDIISQDLDFLIQNGTQIKGRLIEAELLEYLSKIYKIIKNPKE